MIRKKIVPLALSLGALLSSCGKSAVDAGVYLTPAEMSSANAGRGEHPSFRFGGEGLSPEADPYGHRGRVLLPGDVPRPCI